MEDRTYLGAFIYIIIITVLAPFLPTDIYNGGFNADADLSDSFNITSENIDGLAEQLNFFQKIAVLLFTPFLIEDIPPILGAILTIFNYLAFIIGAVFIYDKVRGI